MHSPQIGLKLAAALAKDIATALEAPDRMEQQRVTAAIVGALAHEVNNPLQGILSLTAVLSRECDGQEQSQLRLEQIRSGRPAVISVWLPRLLQKD